MASSSIEGRQIMTAGIAFYLAALRRPALPLPVLAALLAGACTPQLADREVTGSISSDYRVNHPIRMVEGDRSIDIFVGSGRGGLMPEQRAQIGAFASAWRRESSGVLFIEVPAGTPNELAARSTAKEIRSVLAAYGVPASTIQMRVARLGGIASDLPPIRLSYALVQAKVDQCGLWPDDLGPTAAQSTFENRPYYNFGCATQQNLAAMVANPEDLVQPRPETPPMAARRQVVLDKYRQGQDPSTQYEQGQAKVDSSNVGSQ
jgi:pilus assembly protein CpaD